MSEKKEFLVKGRTLTGLVNWLNEGMYVKQTGGKFTVGDVQSYIKRGYIPEYLGKNRIEHDVKLTDVKLYNVLK